MALFKFFHTPKPKGFNYTPVYYDPEKEEREKRKRKYEGGGQNEQGAMEERMRDRFERTRSQKRGKQVMRSNIRLSLILLVLLFLTYFMFFR